MHPLIDTHCHLMHGRLANQLPAVFDRARLAGVQTLICAAADIEESQAACRFAQDHPEVYFLAGVHPHDAKSVAEDQAYLATLEDLAARPRHVAVGEIGLDYHYDFSPRPQQQAMFAQQLDLARRLGKPVVIHTREAFADTLAILRDSQVPGSRVVFHSFTEDAAAATAVLDLGAMISFSGIVTFRNAASLQEAARLVPADRMLIETDAPFLSPEPVRTVKTNEPANVAHVAAFLAHLRGVDIETLAEATTANARGFFGLEQ